MIKQSEIVEVLENNSDLKDLLFPRGFLLTNDKSIDLNVYPFYGLWHKNRFFEYSIFVHPKQNIYIQADVTSGLALVGHAYNPLGTDDEYKEETLLKIALSKLKKNERDFIEYFNNWTGNYVLFVVKNGSLRIYGDAAGMYCTYYGIHDSKVYCSSHTNLLGDICNLDFSDYINRLVNYRFYHLFGKALPGDLSPYDEFKRLIPNHYAQLLSDEFITKRFFLTKEDDLKLNYDEVVKQSSKILSSSMHMIYKKWNRCAISLTGGCDSKTTLSCTNGVYDKYSYYSYESSESENVDAVAAAKICKMLGVEHKTYDISNNDDDFENIESIRKIMEYNSGNIGKDNTNDVRKRAFFIGLNDFDVEVKSWVSEVARAYYHKRFDKRKLPQKITPQYATALYKVFFNDRKLINQTNKVFENYIDEYLNDGSTANIEWYDKLFWEYRMSSWNGPVITGEQQISDNITIPYNNRVLLRIMLNADLDKRFDDVLHKDIMQCMNPKIRNCGISVVNVKHTNKRAKFERMYLDVFSKIFKLM